jgi:protein-disulfide isomerase
MSTEPANPPRMTRPSRLFWLAAACLLLAGPALSALPVPDAASDDAVAQKTGDLWGNPNDPVMGNSHGDVVVVEFFDYNCPYCKAVEPRLEALLKSDPGVKLVLKEFPILTPQSQLATRAALAAVRQGKYARFHQALMNYRGMVDEGVVFDAAKNAGLDIARLKRDMAAPEIPYAIIDTFNQARGVRLFQTPAFIVGTHILTGPSAEIDFPKAVAAVRAKRKG